MSHRNPSRILIADDHVVVRMGLKSMINSQPDMRVVGEATNGESAVTRFRETLPDVLLLDLRMPRLSGIETTRVILEAFPDAKIVVLSTYDSIENIYRALKAGAKTFLAKDMPQEEILSKIRGVIRGTICISPQVASRLAQRLPYEDLSRRETEILVMIVQGKSNKEIAGECSVTESTVKNHVNSLLAKLKVRDRTQAAITALKRGLVSID